MVYHVGMQSRNRLTNSAYWFFIVALASSMIGCRVITLGGFETTYTHSDPAETSYVIGSYQNSWPIVEVDIGGEGPYRMVLDTGADSAILSSELFERLNLNPVTKLRALDIHGKTEEHDLYEISEVDVGPLKMFGLPAIHSQNLEQFFESLEVDGLIGFYGFNKYILDLDYPAGEVRLTDQPIEIGGKGVLPIVDTDGATVFVELSHTGLPGRSSITHSYGVDSGGEFILSIPSDEAVGLYDEGVRRDTGSSHGLNGTQKSNEIVAIQGYTELGDYELEGVTADIGNAHSLIGNELLKLFRVRIDTTSGLIQFEHPNVDAGRVRVPEVYGVGVMELFTLGDRLLITRIANQSPAMLAGLRPNDQVLEINGAVAASSDGFRWLYWIWERPETVSMKIERGDEIHHLEMSMEPLFPKDIESLRRRGPDLELPKLEFEKLPDGSFELHEIE